MRQYKLRRDSQDPRDHVYARLTFGQQLPSSIDLRSMCPPVYNQLSLGSCTNHGIGSLQEFYEIKKGHPYTPLSRLFLYYNERLMEGSTEIDAGASIRDGMKSLVKQGICRDELWKYIIENFAIQPPQEAYVDALNHRPVTYQRITTLDGIKQSLAEKLPVVIGMQVFSSFESEQVAKTGKVTMPAKNEEYLGGHCVLICGYVDTGKTLFGKKKGYFIVRNSWSEFWGDKGYFYLDYDFVSKYCWDFWTVR